MSLLLLFYHFRSLGSDDEAPQKSASTPSPSLVSALTMPPKRTISTDSPLARKNRFKSEIGCPSTATTTSDKSRRASESSLDRTASKPVGKKSGDIEQEINVCDSIKQPKKKADKAAKSKEECPCSQSLGDYWLILCSNEQCNQRWHTHCSNLPGPCSEDIVNSLTANGWLCPWCQDSPFPCPADHPVKKQRVSLLTGAMVSSLCETVRDALENNIIPNISPINSAHTDNLTKELNYQYQSIKADLDNLQEEIAKFSKVSCSIDTQENENQLHKEPAIPTSTLEEPPYASFIENFLDEELLEGLSTYIESVKDKFAGTAKNRKTIYFGEYGYKYGDTKHSPAPFPDDIKSLLTAVKRKMPDHNFNSCLISEYENGSDFCPSHRDDEPWIDPKSDICTFSIGDTRVMRFTKPSSQNHDSEADPIDQPLTNNSMLTCSRKSQEMWKHSIIPEKTVKAKRWSFTLRYIRPHFINSTLIIGDSNTQDLKFGDSKGCFGAWVPGERIKASRINDIPGPESLHPYRNLLLNVGINDINRLNREKTEDLITNLDIKCKTIHQAFPNMKIFISLLLPTTNHDLNSSINEFNQKLHQLVTLRSYFHGAIQHHYLLDNERKLKHACSRDYQHLNSSGLSEFVRVIKTTIIHRRPNNQPPPGNQLLLQSRVTGFAPRRMPTTSPPWHTPAPYSPPVHPPPGVGWLPPDMRSNQEWRPPIQPCPPWFPPPHLGPGASDFNSFNSGCDAYKVRHNIQRVNHRQ